MKNKHFIPIFLLTLISFANLLFNPSNVIAAPQTVTVNIHKLQADAYNSQTGIINEDGSVIDYSTIGTNVRPLAGVEFTYYEITKEQYDQGRAGSMPAQPASGGTTLAPTDQAGLTTWTYEGDTSNPKYYVVYETNKSDNVSHSIAVPFVIAFPMTSMDGSQYLTEVNIYPKNVTGSLPVIGKDIAQLGQNASSFNVGESFNYILKGTIPTNIDQYTQYTFNDTLPAGVTYDSSVEPTITVAGQNLTYGTHFTASNAGQEVTISLNSAGIQAIAGQVPLANRGKIADGDIADATSNTADTPFIEVSFNAFLNTNATVNSTEVNQATITYHNGNTGTTTAASDNVSVVYGDKVFQKVTGDTSEGLANAEFQVFENGQEMKWTQALLDLNQATTDNAALFVNPTLGGNIVLKSGQDGNFDLKGLAYTAQGVDGVTPTTYTLKETKAPQGYQLLADPIEFVIDGSSNTDRLQIKNNIRPVIPETGGMGTLLFIVLGLALMAYAIYSRRHAEEKA